MVEESIGGVGAATTLGAAEVAVTHGIDRQLEQCFGQACFFGEQASGVLRQFDLSQAASGQLQSRRIDREAGIPQVAMRPLVAQPRDARALETPLRRSGDARHRTRDFTQACGYSGRAVFALRRKPGNFHIHFVGRERGSFTPPQKPASTPAFASSASPLG